MLNLFQRKHAAATLERPDQVIGRQFAAIGTRLHRLKPAQIITAAKTRSRLRPMLRVGRLNAEHARALQAICDEVLGVLKKAQTRENFLINQQTRRRIQTLHCQVKVFCVCIFNTIVINSGAQTFRGTWLYCA